MAAVEAQLGTGEVHIPHFESTWKSSTSKAAVRLWLLFDGPASGGRNLADTVVDGAGLGEHADVAVEVYREGNSAHGIQPLKVIKRLDGRDPNNEIQSFVLDADSGSFTLTFDTKTTTVTLPLPTAAAAKLDLIRQKLTEVIGASEFSVTGEGTLLAPWLVTFSGTKWGLKDVPLILVNDTNLQNSGSTATDGTTNPATQGTVTITTTVPGDAGAGEELDLLSYLDKGTFALSFGNRTTGQIPYNATAQQLTTALNSLSNIGTGGVTVTPFSIGLSSNLAEFSTGKAWHIKFTAKKNQSEDLTAVTTGEIEAERAADLVSENGTITITDLEGGSGDDFLMGDASNNRFYYSASLGDQNWGHDVIIGGDGDDILQLSLFSIVGVAPVSIWNNNRLLPTIDYTPDGVDPVPGRFRITAFGFDGKPHTIDAWGIERIALPVPTPIPLLIDSGSLGKIPIVGSALAPNGAT